MTEVISREIYSALQARAEANPANADSVALYRAVEMQIDKGKLRLE